MAPATGVVNFAAAGTSACSSYDAATVGPQPLTLAVWAELPSITGQAAGTPHDGIALPIGPDHAAQVPDPSGYLVMNMPTVVSENGNPIPADAEQSNPKEGSLTKELFPFKKELAVGMRLLHPDWTEQRIAKAVGVSRQTLYRWPAYDAARKAVIRLRSLPTGSKDRDGNMEAWYDEDE
jgi:hypothetical protein